MIAERYINQITDYRDSKKNYLDFTASLQTSFKEGFVEGKVEREMEIAKNAILEGTSDEFIAKITSLSLEQIQELREDIR